MRCERLIAISLTITCGKIRERCHELPLRYSNLQKQSPPGIPTLPMYNAPKLTNLYPRHTSCSITIMTGIEPHNAPVVTLPDVQKTIMPIHVNLNLLIPSPYTLPALQVSPTSLQWQHQSYLTLSNHAYPCSPFPSPMCSSTLFSLFLATHPSPQRLLSPLYSYFLQPPS